MLVHINWGKTFCILMGKKVIWGKHMMMNHLRIQRFAFTVFFFFIQLLWHIFQKIFEVYFLSSLLCISQNCSYMQANSSFSVQMNKCLKPGRKMHRHLVCLFSSCFLTVLSFVFSVTTNAFWIKLLFLPENTCYICGLKFKCRLIMDINVTVIWGFWWFLWAVLCAQIYPKSPTKIWLNVP